MVKGYKFKKSIGFLTSVASLLTHIIDMDN